MKRIRLFDLLIKLRTDELERYTAWQNAIRQRAKAFGDPGTLAARIQAENALKDEDAPEWCRLEGDRYLEGKVWKFRTTLWKFVVAKLQSDRALTIEEVELFEAVRSVSFW